MNHKVNYFYVKYQVMQLYKFEEDDVKTVKLKFNQRNVLIKELVDFLPYW